MWLGRTVILRSFAVTCQLGNKRYLSRRVPQRYVHKYCIVGEYFVDKVTRKHDDEENEIQHREPRKLSAFNLYMQKMLPVMKQQHPELSHKEVFKVSVFLQVVYRPTLEGGRCARKVGKVQTRIQRIVGLHVSCGIDYLCRSLS